jgi:uncharacterized membrane protein YGL010W
MQTINQLLDEYASSHVNKTNKIIHWICVPPIVWTVVALLWSLPFPGELSVMGIPVNWAVIVMVFLQIYYFKLSTPLALGFIIVNIALLMLTAYIASISPWPLWQVAVMVFVLAWIGQFIGHVFEGKRPSFFKDVQFLLIGPLWLLAAVYRTAGIKY